MFYHYLRHHTIKPLNSFSSKNRAHLKEALSTSKFDLLVIGGGITGAGIALDATARGLKVALVEMQDFASGSSGRSTKLIHGGLRYLKQMEFALVSEVGKERAIIHRIAPHLTKPETMLLPITKSGSFGKITTMLAMFVYEWLAGVKKHERHLILNKQQTLNKEPLLQKNDLSGGVLFYEYRTDDARLTIEVVKEAVKRGAQAINYMKVIGFVRDGEKINGAQLSDMIDGSTSHIYADYVVNASGPWVDDLDSLDPSCQTNKLQITKGVHIVVDQNRFPVKQSLYFDTYDKRMIFIIPREGKVYIGTTDTFYKEDKIHPAITSDDKLYLLKCVNDYFPEIQLVNDDIESAWVGLRPLIKKSGKKPSEISRKDETFVWDSGLITIAGGKLTGYRKMAERVVDLISKKIMASTQKQIPQSSTSQINISGGNLPAGISFTNFLAIKINEGIDLKLTAAEVEKLIYRYGFNVEVVFSIINRLNSENTTSPDLPIIIKAQLLYVIENEMCLTPADFFIRRTSMLYFDIANLKRLRVPVISFLKDQKLWDESLVERFDNELLSAIHDVE